MVNRTNRNTGREIDKPIKSDAVTTRKYIAKSLSSRNINTNDNPVIDDVISHLANAHENRRARQVTEWERMLGQKMQRAA